MGSFFIYQSYINIIRSYAICAQIGAYISATRVGVPLGIGVGGICAALNTFFATYSSVLPGLVSELCNSAEFQEFSFTGQVSFIRVVLKGPDRDYTGDWVRVNFIHPLPTLSVNLGDQYLHMLEIYGVQLDCSPMLDTYVDHIYVGSITNDLSAYTTVTNGDNLVYAKDGDVFSQNYLIHYFFECYPYDESGVIKYGFRCR